MREVQENNSNQLSLKDFAKRFVVVPLSLALLLIALGLLETIFDTVLPNNIAGSELSQGLILGIFIYIVYVAIAFYTAMGVWYTFRKAGNNWRYYLLLTISPLLIFLWQGMPLVILSIQGQSPDRVRYAQNRELCNEIYQFDSLYKKISTEDTSDYPKIALNKYASEINSVNRQYDNISKNIKLIYKPACSGSSLTEDELSQIKQFTIQQEELSVGRENILEKLTVYKEKEQIQWIESLEKTENAEEVYRKASEERVDRVGSWQLITACNYEGIRICHLKWVNQRNSEEKSTKELLAIYNAQTEK